jgi:hypothetical protein
VKKESMMKLQAYVSLLLLAGGLPSALARMPFESDFGARLGPTKDLTQQQRGALGNQKVSVGNARP